MAWAKKTARTAEKKVFGKGGFKGRYGIGKGKGGFKFGTVLKDLEMIKSRLNVEKKTQSVDVVTATVAQAYFNQEAAWLGDVTPAIQQGIDSNQRIGNSLKLTGMNFPIQFSSQSHTRNARKLKVQLFKVLSADNGVTPQELFDDYYEVNPLNGIRDMNSPRAYRTAKQDGIKLLRTKFYTLKSPNMDVTGTDGERTALSVNFAVKLEDVLRYERASDTQPDGIRYIMLIMCDAGNTHPSTDSSLDIPVKSPNTGVEVRMAQKYWWVDN